jgi:YVTN family beta-propeller protein
MRYDPAVRPRALALVDALGKVFVAGQAAGRVFVVDIASGTVTTSIAVGAEPTAVVASPDGAWVYVVNHQSATVQQIDARGGVVVATATIAEHPWGASLRADGSLLYVSHLLLSPGVTMLGTSPFAVLGFTALPKEPPAPAQNKLLPNGEVRGEYTVVPRPGTGELWVPHMLLAIDTPQPSLDFQSTVFPAISVLAPGGGWLDTRLELRPSTVLTATGAFIDVVSGPHDVAFTPDGTLALMVDAQSEDVLVFDAASRFEVSLVRPVPSAFLEGVVVSADGVHAYLSGRSTHDVTVLSIAAGAGGPTVAVDGPAIECLAMDPMPPALRHGLRLFYSSNSAAFPLTQNFWVACASCHLEGGTDAVVWKFKQGPRDTPSNAGGPINTGFLFRQAVRNTVLDYDETIRVEQGGAYHRTDPNQIPDLQALADFTNYAIPFPRNPYLSPDGTLTPLQATGKVLFDRACGSSCHSGPFLTDSGQGNPMLDLSGSVKLHNIGTCVTSGQYQDQPSLDVEGHPRDACYFDTPTLRGIFATAPYLHDGSAATLDDVVRRLPASSGLPPADQAAIVAYLKTL